ncbi:MAG TPA: hypothetical protein VHL11_03585 [Phototrophicaceae bacterium]|jgi:hypothetical protein|nr:hypothetical protein [Phototrophicaceae bacterium]
MKSLKYGFTVSLIALALVGFISTQPVIGQQQQPQPTAVPTATPVAQSTVDFGGSTEVNGAAGAVQVSFTVPETQFVDVLVRSVDGVTNPRIILYNDKDRLLSYSEDFTARRDDLNDIDALIEDTFLIPGTYKVRIETQGGDGNVNLTISTGKGGILGLGQMTTIRRDIAPNTRFSQPISLKKNELISIMAISESATFDPRLSLRGPDELQVAKNDDTDSFDALLDVTDAKIENFVAPVDGLYRAEVRGFSSQDTGTVQLLFFRYGTLEPVAEHPLVFTGKINQRERISFPLNLEAGELINVTAIAAPNSQVDPQVALLDPDNVIVISNDDHAAKNEQIGRYDAQFSNYITQLSGTYTLDLESVGGRGAYQLTIVRAGKLNPGLVGDPIDVNAGVVVIPAPPAESTAEVTP